MRILLIEDDKQAAAYLVKGLNEAGFNVEHASDGRDGLYLATSEPCDLVIVDRMLPGLDGLAIIQALRTQGHKTPILILSAPAQVDDRVRGLRAGGDDYLTKPYSFAELMARSRPLLRRLDRSRGGVRKAARHRSRAHSCAQGGSIGSPSWRGLERPTGASCGWLKTVTLWAFRASLTSNRSGARSRGRAVPFCKILRAKRQLLPMRSPPQARQPRDKLAILLIFACLLHGAALGTQHDFS